MNQQPDPIVVCGAPRSGTTYTCRILNTHPQVFISHEIRLFTWVNRSLNVITKNEEVLLNHRDDFIEHAKASFPAMIRDFYRQKWPRAIYWGDKNPHYTDPHNKDCLWLVAELFPGARFVHVLRDGRDVISSLLRKRNEKGEPWADFEKAHRKWMNNTDIAMEFGRSVGADRYVEVRYEQLVEDDAEMARRLFDALDIPIHPSVLDFCRSQQGSRTPFSAPTRDLSEGAGSSDWRSVLSPDERIRSLDLIGGHLIKYGYETRESLSRTRRHLTAEKSGSASNVGTGDHMDSNDGSSTASISGITESSASSRYADAE